MARDQPNPRSSSWTRGMIARPSSLLKGDAAIWRRVVEMTVEDRRRICFWAAVARGCSIVTRWQSAEQRQRATIAVMEARNLGQSSARLRQDFMKLFEQENAGDRLAPAKGRQADADAVRKFTAEHAC